MNYLNSSRLFSTFAICTLLLVGCGGDKYASEGEADTDVAEAEANPLAQYAGDWMTESFVGDDTEPALVVLMKATDSYDTWAMRFTHIDDLVPANSVVVDGDSVVSTWGPFPSGLREGIVVESMTAYMKADGDNMSGRAVANYSDGEVVNIRLEAVKQ